jgi:hypothetical protein
MTNDVEIPESHENDHHPVVRGDLRRLKIQMDHRFDELRDHFDASIENIVEQLKGANADELSSLHDAKTDHGQRLCVLEQRAGLR